MSSQGDDTTNVSSACGGSSKSFLQQTTSQLLHQQEALRRRREMLERESRKPPVMRFGLNSPPRSRSPVPRTHSHTPPPPAVASVGTTSLSERRHRTVSKDGRKETPPPVVIQPPMRFSMAYRPTPTPAAGLNASLRTTSLSPTPLEVNKISSRGRSLSQKRKRARLSRSRSPTENDEVESRGHGQSEDVLEPFKDDEEPREQEHKRKEKDISVEIFLPKRPRPSSLPPATASGKKDTSAVPETSHDDAETETPKELEHPSTGMEEDEALVPVGGATTASNTDATPLRTGQDKACTGLEAGSAASLTHPRPSSEFALPQYTPTPVALARLSNMTTTSVTPGRMSVTAGGAEKTAPMNGIEVAEATLGDSQTTGFLTPRPVASRTSFSGLPAPPPSRNLTDASENPLPVGTADAGVSPPRGPFPSALATEAVSLAFSNAKPQREDPLGDGSPAPTPADVIASMDASAEKRCCGRPAHNEPHVCDKTPRTRRATSPVPTAKDLIESVMAVAASDKRPCGCDRPTPSPNLYRSSFATVSPPPTPVGHAPELNTSEQAKRNRVDDRPSPVSMATSASKSTNAAQVPRADTTNSPSPWPTTENLVQSIAISADKTKPRYDEKGEVKTGSPADTTAETGESRHARAVREGRTPSPGLTPQHIIDSIHASADKSFAKEEAVSRSKTAGGSGQSPEPTEAEIAASVLASVEKRHRCGRPTPTVTGRESHADKAENDDPSVLDSASPIPTTDQLLESLEVTTDRRKGDRSSEPPVHQESAKSHTARSPRAATPSPVPTQERVDASVLASADKRKHRVSVAVSGSPTPASRRPRVELGERGSFAPPPAFPSSEACDEEGLVGSPTLTPQHIKDSMRKIAEEQAAGATRSNAQEPTHLHSTSPLPTEKLSKSEGGTNHSPEVTEEHIQESVAAMRDDRSTMAKRSAAVPPSSATGTSCSPVPPQIPIQENVTCEDVHNEEGAEENTFSNVNSDHDDKEEEGEEHLVGETIAGVSKIAPVPVESPVASDICMDSALFKDCVSAAATPAVPHLPAEFLALQQEVKAISEGRTRVSGSLTPPPAPRPTRRSAPRRLSATPASLPPTAPPPAEESDIKETAPAQKPKISLPTEFMVAATEIVEKTVKEALHGEDLQKPVDDKDALRAAADVARRSSMLLVDEASEPAYPTLIQEPHLPMPEAPPKSPPPVSIPRTPTPPPRPHAPPTMDIAVIDEQQQPATAPLRGDVAHEMIHGRGAGRMLPDSHFEASLSPLPRPVTLSSQVGKTAFSSQMHVSHTPQAPAVAPSTSASGSKSASSILIDGPTPVHTLSTRTAQKSSLVPATPHQHVGFAGSYSVTPREGRSTPYPRGSTLIDGGHREDNERHHLTQREDPRSYAEEEASALATTGQGALPNRFSDGGVSIRSDHGGARTFTVSPRANAVILMSHQAEEGRVSSPGAKRARVSSNNENTSATLNDPHEETLATPSSSDRPARESRRRSSGTGGRRSAVDQLLDMLPVETQEEVLESIAHRESQSAAEEVELQRNSNASIVGGIEADNAVFTSPSQGRRTTDTISSQVSESGTAGSIAERVARREHKEFYDYDYYLKYMNELNRDSAKKSRRKAAKRMQRNVVKDVREGQKEPVTEKDAPQTSAAESDDRLASPPAKKARQDAASTASASPSSGRRSALAPSQGVSVADIEVSPLTPQSQSLSQIKQRSTLSPSEVVTGRVSKTGRVLAVSTRLSAELKEALFQQPEAPPPAASPSPKRSTPASKSPTTTAEGAPAERAKTKTKAGAKKKKLKLKMAAQKAARKQEELRHKKKVKASTVSAVTREPTTRTDPTPSPVAVKATSPTKSSPRKASPRNSSPKKASLVKTSSTTSPPKASPTQQSTTTEVAKKKNLKLRKKKKLAKKAAAVERSGTAVGPKVKKASKNLLKEKAKKKKSTK